MFFDGGDRNTETSRGGASHEVPSPISLRHASVPVLPGSSFTTLPQEQAKSLAGFFGGVDANATSMFPQPIPRQ